MEGLETRRGNVIRRPRAAVQAGGLPRLEARATLADVMGDLEATLKAADAELENAKDDGSGVEADLPSLADQGERRPVSIFVAVPGLAELDEEIRRSASCSSVGSGGWGMGGARQR